MRNQHVTRTEANSRQKAFQEERKLVEGGTTNRTAMLKFKNGAFRLD